MTRFLAIGECMVEMAPEPDGRFQMGFAGDTFNTAWYARRLAKPGTEIAYLTAIGDDAISAQMEAFIQDAGIRPELAVRPGMGVGLYLITLKEGERHFTYWRKMSAARTLADNLSKLPGLTAGDTAFFSGITVAILPEVGRENLLTALRNARSEGIRIAFDPNLRPALWSSDDEMRNWVNRAAEVADIALPSFEDEAIHFGDADPAATATRYSDLGADLVVVKNGPEPVLIRSGEQEETVTPQPAEAVVDTTAAGDSFNAGFLMALDRGASLAGAANEACALSRRVIAARGALVAI